MRQSCSNDKATERVADEAYAGKAGDWTELLDVILDLICKPETHFQNVSLSLFFIALTTQKDAIWMQNRKIILQQPHINRVALKAMLQHEQVHTNIVVDTIKTFNLIFGHDLLLCYFVASLDLLHESEIIVFDIAFLKDYGRDFMLGC